MTKKTIENVDDRDNIHNKTITKVKILPLQWVIVIATYALFGFLGV